MDYEQDELTFTPEFIEKLNMLQEFVENYKIQIPGEPVEDSETEDFALNTIFYFISTKQVPSENNEYLELRDVFEETADFDEILKQTEEKISSLKDNMKDYRQYRDLLLKFLPLFTIWYFIACDPLRENKNVVTRAKRKEDYNNLMSKIQEQIKEIYDNNRSLQTQFSPLQSVNVLLGQSGGVLQICKHTLDKIQMDYSQFAKYKDIIKPIPNILKKLGDIVTEGYVQDPPDHYSQINFNDLMNCRDQLNQVAFLTGHIDTVSGLDTAASISVLLYHIDNVLYASSVMPLHPCNPIDAVCAAQDVERFIQKFNVGGNLPDIIESIIEVYHSNYIVAGTNKLLYQCLEDCIGEFEEKIIKKNIIDDDPAGAYFFAISFSRLIHAINNIKTESGAFIASSDILMELQKNQKNLQGVEEEIITRSGRKLLNMTTCEFDQYIINPSRNATSIKPLTDKSRSKKAFARLPDVAKTLHNFNDKYNTSTPPLINDIAETIRSAYKTITQAFQVADLSENRDDFFDCIEQLNQLIQNAHQDISKKIPDDTPSLLLGHIYNKLLMIREDLRNAATKNELKTKIKPVIKLIREMQNRYINYKDGLNDAQLSLHSTEFTEDLKILTEIDIGPEIDNTIRESYFENHRSSLLEQLGIVEYTASSMSPGKFNVREIADSLLKAVHELEAVYETPKVFSPTNILFARFLESNRHIINTIHMSLFLKRSELKGMTENQMMAQNINAITQLRSDLEGVNPIMRLTDNSTGFREVLNNLSVARWQASHLESFYKNDEEINKEIDAAKTITEELIHQYKEVSYKVGISQYHEVRRTLRKMTKRFSKNSERNGNEQNDSYNALLALLAKIYAFMCMPDKYQTREKQNSLRIQLNKLIVALGYQEIELKEAMNPYDQFKGSKLDSYALKLSETAGISEGLAKTMNHVIEHSSEINKDSVQTAIQQYTALYTSPEINQQTFTEIRENNEPIIFMYCIQNCEQYEQELENTLDAMITSQETQHEGLLQFNCEVFKILDITPTPQVIVDFLETGDMQHLAEAYYACTQLSESIPELTELAQVLINIYKGEDDLQVHDFTEIRRKLIHYTIDSINTELSSLIIDNSLQLCISNDFLDFDDQLLTSLEPENIAKFSLNASSSDENEVSANSRNNDLEDYQINEEALQLLSDQLSEFVDISSREILYIAIGGLALKVKKANTVTLQTDSEKALLQKINQQWSTIISSSKNNLPRSQGKVTIAYVLDVFAYRLNHLLRLSQPHVDEIGFWGDYFAFILKKLSKVAGDAILISQQRDFLESISDGIGAFCKNMEVIGFKNESRSLFDCFQTLTSMMLDTQNPKPIFETASNAKSQLQDTENTVIKHFPNLKDQFQKYFELFISQLDKLENMSYEEQDSSLLSIINHISNIPLLIDFTGESENVYKTIDSLNECRISIHQFDGKVYEKYIKNAVKAMKNDNIDNDIIEEVRSMGLCTRIVTESVNRRLETMVFLKHVSATLGNNVVSSIEAINSCAKYIEETTPTNNHQ